MFLFLKPRSMPLIGFIRHFLYLLAVNTHFLVGVALYNFDFFLSYLVYFAPAVSIYLIVSYFYFNKKSSIVLFPMIIPWISFFLHIIYETLILRIDLIYDSSYLPPLLVNVMVFLYGIACSLISRFFYRELSSTFI